jgi:hypothetical protein
MDEECSKEVTMIDDKGFVYCGDDGLLRRDWRRCRKLRPHELNRLRRGEPLRAY